MYLSEATAYEPHLLPSSPVNVTNEKGEDVTLRHRSHTELNSPTSPCPHASPNRPYSSSLNSDSAFSPRGGVSRPDHAPVATSSPFSSSKATPTVAHTTASSVGVSSPSSGTTSEKLVIGDESLDFMKVSMRVSPTSPPQGGGGVASLPVGVGARYPGSSRREEVEGGGVEDGGREGEEREFRSILLFIPLRLGQDTFNMTYADPLKVCSRCFSLGF